MGYINTMIWSILDVPQNGGYSKIPRWQGKQMIEQWFAPSFPPIFVDEILLLPSQLLLCLLLTTERCFFLVDGAYSWKHSAAATPWNSLLTSPLLAHLTWSPHLPLPPPARLPSRPDGHGSEPCGERMLWSGPGPERMPDRMPERMSDRMSEYMSDRIPDRRSEYVSDRMPVGGDHSKNVILLYDYLLQLLLCLSVVFSSAFAHRI